MGHTGEASLQSVQRGSYRDGREVVRRRSGGALSWEWVGNVESLSHSSRAGGKGPIQISLAESEEGSVVKIFTIGFTKKSAERFFETLRVSGAKRVIDVRLNNVSQLAGFAKKQDLPYFLEKICGMEYLHLPILAPTHDMFDEYKTRRGRWDIYEQRFVQLMKERCIEERVPRELMVDSCLLCSEPDPRHCHRRLIAEYLKERWGDVEIVHL